MSQTYTKFPQSAFHKGTCPCSEQQGDPENQRLLDEMKQFGDIVRLDVVDSYDDLSRKTLKMLSVLPEKIDAYFYFKVDDDVAVNIDAMETYLTEQKNQGNLYMVRWPFFPLCARLSEKSGSPHPTPPDYPTPPQTRLDYAVNGQHQIEGELRCHFRHQCTVMTSPPPPGGQNKHTIFGD